MPTISGFRRTRLHARSDPRVLQAHRREQVQQHGRDQRAGELPPRRPEQARPARDGRAPAAEGGHHNYPEGQTEELDAVNNPEDAVRRHAEGAVRPRAVHRAGRLHAKSRRPSISASSPATRCGCATPTSSSARTSMKDAAGNVTEVHCTYDPATRGGDSPGRPEGEGHDPLGQRRRTRSTPRCGSTITCSTSPTPRMCPKARTGRSNLNPNRWKRPAGAKVEPSVKAAAVGDEVPVRAARLLRRRQGFDAGQAGVQPGGVAEGHVGEGTEEVTFRIRNLEPPPPALYTSISPLGVIRCIVPRI